MRSTESPNREGRRAPTNEDRNLALPAVPAASTNGSTGRQQVKAASTLPTADSAAATPPLGDTLPVGLIVSLFIRSSFPLRLGGLSVRPDEPSPPVEARSASIQDTNGNSARNSERPAILPLHLVHQFGLLESRKIQVRWPSHRP